MSAVSVPASGLGEQLRGASQKLAQDEVAPGRGERVGGLADLGPGEAELVEGVVGDGVEVLGEGLGQHGDGDERAVGAEQAGPFGVPLRDCLGLGVKPGTVRDNRL